MSGTRLDKADNGGKDWSRGKKGKLDETHKLPQSLEKKSGEVVPS